MSSMYERPGLPMPGLTPAIKRLLLINAAVFVLNMVLVGRLSEAGGRWLAFSWAKAWEGYGLGWLRLLTYQFTHSFHDVWHVLWNMMVLYLFGTMAERSLGYRGTYKLYLTAGVAAALVHLAFASLRGYQNVALVGASGSCYAFLVYAACMAPRAVVILIFFPIQLVWLATIAVFIAVYATYVEVVTGYPDGVANSAHVGGAAFGFLAYRRGWFRDFTPYAYNPGVVGGLRQRVLQWRSQRQAQRAAAEREELDRLLEKVHRSGLQSLTGGERRFLDRQSKRSGR